MKRHLNPAGLYSPGIYTQVVETQGGRTLYIAGQVAWDAQGNVVAPGDLRGQMRQAFENLKTALAAAGGTLEDVVKLTIYIVNYGPEQRPAFVEVFKEYLGIQNPPANTLIGVQSLARAELLVEIDAFAVID